MDISELRGKIDAIDKQLVEMINERAECAIEIGKMKNKGSKSIFAPEREVQVLNGVLRNNKGPLADKTMSAVFREVISACRALEKPISVAYFGPAGSNTHVASILKFGDSTDFTSGNTIPDVFNSVERKETNYGVVPVENSTEGVMNHTLDMFLLSDLRICAEIYAPIIAQPALLRRPSYRRSSASTRSRSPPRSAETGSRRTCRASRSSRFEHVQGRQDVRGLPQLRRHRHRLAAKEYGLNILEEGIEDNPHNKTRFLVVGYSKPNPSGKDKTSIVYAVPHKSGSLYHSLKVFDSHGINLTMIESRPTKQMPWEYIFFVDFQGHESDDKVQAALKELSEISLFVRVLGSYPEAE